LHLFDVAIKGGEKFKESNFIKSGENFTIFDTEFCKFGIGICHDVRFPEYSMILTREFGAEFLVFVSGFGAKSGPDHWDILRRARALDN